MKFYKSELKKYPHSRSLKAIEALAKFRGISSGFKYAEGFVLVREIENNLNNFIFLILIRLSILGTLI